MKKSIVVVLGLLATLVVAKPASAQGVVGVYRQPQMNNPFSRPAVSPYLNLFRGGSSGAVNYYNLVQPQQQIANEIQQLQQRQNVLVPGGQQGITESPLGGALGGGTNYFQNHHGFFLTVPTGPVGVGGR